MAVRLSAQCLTALLEGHPLSALRDCLFSIFAAALHTWRPSPPSATWRRAMPWWQGTHLTCSRWNNVEAMNFETPCRCVSVAVACAMRDLVERRVFSPCFLSLQILFDNKTERYKSFFKLTHREADWLSGQKEITLMCKPYSWQMWKKYHA
jgi:hypothetical protein